MCLAGILWPNAAKGHVSREFLQAFPVPSNLLERGKFAALPSCILCWRTGGVSHPAAISPWRQMILNCRVRRHCNPRVAVLLGGVGATRRGSLADGGIFAQSVGHATPPAQNTWQTGKLIF